MSRTTQRPCDQASSIRPDGEPGDPLVIVAILGELHRALVPIAARTGVPLPGLLDGPDSYGRFVDRLRGRERRTALAAFARAEERLKPHYEVLSRRHRRDGAPR